MGARQERQRPCSSSQPSSGRLSRQAIGVAQAGQDEPGRTTDPCRGTRWMTTLANEPAARPSSPASEATRRGLMAAKRTCPAPAQARRSTWGRPAGRTRRQLLPRQLLELGAPEAEGAGDPRRVVEVQVVPPVDGVGVEGAVVVVVAVTGVAVVLQVQGTVLAVEQDRELRREL